MKKKHLLQVSVAATTLLIAGVLGFAGSAGATGAPIGPNVSVDSPPATSPAPPTLQACQTATYSGVIRDTDVSLDPAVRKTWYSEDGAPTFLTVGAKFITPLTTSKNNLFRSVNVPLAGLRGLGYHVDNTTAFPTAAYDLEVLTTGTAGYMTFVYEPYQQAAGNAVNTDGNFTGIESGKWWGSHITTGPGSQASPISLADLSALYPSAVVISYGVGQGSNNAGSMTTLYSLGFLCGTDTFTNVPAVVVTTTTSTPPPTSPPKFKPYVTQCAWDMPKGDTEAKAFVVDQILVACAPKVTVPTTCGHLYQIDDEHINNQSDQDVLDHLMKVKKLHSQNDDKQITKSWSFIKNKDCVTETTTSSSSSSTVVSSSASTTSSSPTKTVAMTPVSNITGGSGLAFTGFNAIGGTAVGLLVLVLGTVFTIRGRRRAH